MSSFIGTVTKVNDVVHGPLISSLCQNALFISVLKFYDELNTSGVSKMSRFWEDQNRILQENYVWDTPTPGSLSRPKVGKVTNKNNTNKKQTNKTPQWPVFSSPELKAQVSFSDHVSSAVLPSVRLSVCKLFTFSSSSPEPLGQFQPNLAQSIPEGDSSLFKWRAPPFSKGR